MRANEFIVENGKSKPSKRQHYATVGLNIFTDSPYDRIYLLNRVMMAAASTDGTNVPNLDGESPVGKWNAALPYTKVDQDKLNKAYKAAGVKHVIDLNHGDLESHELDSTNKISPVRPFKGYKK